MKHFLKNIGVNVGVNLNKNERQIIELILNDPTLTSEKLSIKIIKQKLDKKKNKYYFNFYKMK